MTNIWIDGEKIDRACRKQERKNLRATGKSWTWATIFGKVCKKYCLEERDNTLLMAEGWREFIKTLKEKI